MIENNYYISFVVTTRNDDHGENMSKKNQFFLDMWSKQVKKYNISSELIIVEWNPDPNKPLLKDKLNFPELNENQIVRIITVPNSDHKKFENSEKLKIFQMIGKNVGIKRSNGKFILVTNIDIIFSDDFFEFLSKKNLKEDTVYRCDRYDVNYKKFNSLNFDEKEILKHCTIINKKLYSIDTKTKKKSYVQISIYSMIYFAFKGFKKIFSLKHKRKKYAFLFNYKKFTFIKLFKIIFYFFLFPFYKFITRTTKYYFGQLIVAIFKKKIHTNACGDFTLTCKKTWFDLNGYYEYEGYSWHLDSIFLFKALCNKKKFIDLEYKIYHINQTDRISGYIVGEKHLFNKLAKDKIKYIDDKRLNKIIKTLEKNPRYLKNNKWGMENKILNENKYFKKK